MKYLKCLKLGHEMECKLSEIIWFTKEDGFGFLRESFWKCCSTYLPHIGVFKRCKVVCTDWNLEYDHTYVRRSGGFLSI